MKRILCILLMLIWALPAFAEEAPFAPYILTAPEGVTLEERENVHTFVHGLTRVVTMVIPRVPDEKPAEAVIRMMTQFEPGAIIGEDLPLSEGYYGLTARNQDKFGEGIDQMTVMILSAEGDLLILSGYGLDGDEEKVQALLDALIAGIEVEGKLIRQPASVLLPSL